MSLLTTVQQPSLCNFYFALAGDPSLNNANWASFPATTTINASGNAIDNASSVEIDGYVLTAGPNQLLLDGVPLVTTTTLSSIADWSLYESLSGGVDMAGYRIKNISGLVFLGGNVLRAAGGKVLVNNLDVVRLWAQCNALTDIDAGGHSITNVGWGVGTIQTGGDDNILVNGIDVVSKWSHYYADRNVNMNNQAILNAGEVDCTVLKLNNDDITTVSDEIFVNGLPAGRQWSTFPAVSDVSMARNSIQDLSSIDFYYGPGASVLLNASGGFLYANGSPLAIGNPASNWSTFPAVSDVNIANYNVSGVRSMYIRQQTVGCNALTSIGPTNLYGRFSLWVTENYTGPTIYWDTTTSETKWISKSDNYFNGNSNHLNGNCNIIGATSYASSNYIYGGTTIDGGYVRGCSIGCLPIPVFPYLNTQRIDVLPAGILMTSPTFITMNGLGAGNFTMGGAMAFSAGSYMTLEHGFGVGSNGIYVQDTARDDAARMIFEFGGSIGNSIDTPTRAGNMDFYGTRMYMANIYATSRGGRYPRLPYLNIYDISQLNFFSGASIIGSVSGSKSITLSGNVIFSNATFNGLTMNGNINMSGNIISNCQLLSTVGVDANTMTSSNLYMCNVYLDTYATSNTINVWSPVTFRQGVSGGGIFTDSIGVALSGSSVITITGNLHFANSSVSGSYITGGTGGTSISGGLAITGPVSVSSGNLNMGGNSITNCSNITVGRITDLNFITSTTGINVSANIVGFNGDIAVSATADVSELYVNNDSHLNTITGTPTLVGVDLNFNGRTGTNVITPVLPSNIANKDYVDKHNPITYTEATTPVNIYSTTPVPIAAATVVLTASARIWVVGTTTYDNIGAGAADFIVSSFLVINSVSYGTTRTSIPARFSPTVPSSTNVVVQAVIPTALPAGSYVATLYASANVANTDVTADHSDLVATGGYF